MNIFAYLDLAGSKFRYEFCNQVYYAIVNPQERLLKFWQQQATIEEQVSIANFIKTQ